MLQIILLLLPGVLSDKMWNVTYPELSICAVRGSDVSIPCIFTYPKNQSVTQVSWCSNTSHVNCDKKGPYVYNSTHNTNQNNFIYTGDNTSNCSLLIRNINSTSSGQYLFRFITNSTAGRFTGSPGVNVTVTDLRVSMSRLTDNGTIKAGNSLNLTCKFSCPGHSSKLQWFQNNKPINQSDPVLTFSCVTPQDSGNYSCSLRNFKSKQITLYVEDTPALRTWTWIMITGVSSASIIFILVCVILITRRAKTKNKQPVKERGETQRSDDVCEEEIQYASVSIRPKEPSANTEPQNDDSTIYSGVRAN